MAKARDLAALAGLAGLAYAMRNKSKPNEDAGDQKTSSYTGDTKKVESKDGDEGYKNNVLKAITQKREGSNDQAGNQGVLGGDKPASKSTSKPASKAAPKLETFTTRKDPREAEAGMSRGTRTTSMAGAGRGVVNPPSVSATDPRSAEAGMSRGTRTTVPPFKGGQRGYDEAGNFMGGQRGYDEAGNPMKKGGKVKTKKMASGGMTASSRADGIASRGKTKCKMY